MTFQRCDIANWGNYPKIGAEVSSPEFLSDLKVDVAKSSKLIARGNGRSYGDAGLNDRVVSMTRFNKFLDFDPTSGDLTCQAGTLLSDVLAFSIPRGFFLSVTPGTKFVTVGGAIASDVHGKNHHQDGCFSNYISWLRLLTEDGSLVVCSPSENSEVFWRTVGGMGLTGVIVDAKIRLRPIETAYIRQESHKAANLDEAMELFQSSKDWTYLVAWIDCSQMAKKQGRSLVMRGEHASSAELPQRLMASKLAPKLPASRQPPFFLPSWVVNKYSIQAFNSCYYAKQLRRFESSIVSYDKFFYPLDRIQAWNKVYGRTGFTQYQLVLPLENSRKGLSEVLDAVQRSDQRSALSVLKLLGKSNPLAPHSFPIEGYTLALDFKIRPNLKQLISELDNLVVKYGGRVYLAKDAFSSSKVFDYFPAVEKSKFGSIQSQRLFASRQPRALGT